MRQELETKKAHITVRIKLKWALLIDPRAREKRLNAQKGCES